MPVYRLRERRGLIKWFLEDRDRTDGNAPFFICMGLIPLRKYFSGELGDKCCSLIDEILSEVHHFFMHKCEYWGCYYPNSFLGDIVFAWLINEMCGNEKNDEFLLKTLNGSARYWLEDGWGWGEHMSDGYAMVCNYEISMLLLMAERLPETTRQLYLYALGQLLNIEDSYGGKPRTPTIRSYSFEETPEARPFRKIIKDWQPDEEIQIFNLPPIGQLLNRLGWHKIVPPPAPPKEEIEVPCFNNTKASAYIAGDFRIGGMSRYPVMEYCDYLNYGLSWQSFPVTFLHDNGDWGFLQWLAEEDGKTFAHPSHTKNYDMLKGLSVKVNPPIAGNTFSLRQGGSLLVLRGMPAISTAWTRLVDRLRVISPSAEIEERNPAANFSTLLFKWPGGRKLSVARVTLSTLPSHAKPRLEDGKLDWGIEYDASALPVMSDAVILWAFCIDAEITEPPVIKAEELKRRPVSMENYIFDLDWKTGKVRWRMKINPVIDNPFIEI